MAETTLSARALTFGYGRKPVLDHLTIDLVAGRTVLLGPNGAGKSTLMSLVAGVLRPRSGTISLSTRDGAVPRYGQRAYRSRLAWLPQDITPMPGLTVREHVAYSGWLKGMSRRAAWDASVQALQSVNLSELAAAKATRLSGGQTRRMALAGSLVHDADVILLDEPTAGLDPNQRDQFRTVLADLPSDVVTVVSTHQTEDLVDSYDRAVVLVNGTVRFQGAVSDLIGRSDTSGTTSATAAAYRRLVGVEL